MARKKQEVIEEVIEVVEEIKEEVVEEPKAVKGYVTATGGLRVREEQNTNSKVIEIKKFNNEVEILEDCGEWVRVPNGFMMKKWLKIEE